MPASVSSNSNSNDSSNGHGCCQDCACCKQAYEHLPVPRLRHQQPPPPLYHSPKQHQQQLQQQQQVSCITTLQQTTTTQQLPQIPTGTTSNYCLMPTTTTSNTYVSNVKPEQLRQHCHSHCDGHNTNMQSFGSSSNMTPAVYQSSPAVYQTSAAQSMIFVPFMLPMQQQQHQQHLQQQPPLPPSEDCKPLLRPKSVPPPPQPPPLLSNFPPLLQPPLLQPPVVCPPPAARTPAMPMTSLVPTLPQPTSRSVRSLKSAAAAAVSVYQRNGKLPRSLPALRAMEVALRTNSFATPPRVAAAERTEGGQGDGSDAGQDMEDSDEEMEYMPPLHNFASFNGEFES
ncbi:protein hunchback-like [Drosophila serrata]|uniref:protein hunchback-like n=1 Tax=Drosophila serrata TaxID=7274 RepID=UPI000A1D11D0|nr:protein hunchback-like [Drosophila serrata]